MASAHGDKTAAREAVRASMKSAAATDARGATNMLMTMQNKAMWNAFTALQTVTTELHQHHFSEFPELHPEIQEIEKHYKAAYADVQLANDELNKLLKKMGFSGGGGGF
jgi:hypothetical protein